ncbi:MAG TPA: MBL fold metallo-hydrolase [Polyangiaceae bacterium]|jgi:metallo-beta-lactamase family protein|nr:MBL fold metallo-hydrolase [Polyangiaceae bacterium]
MIRIEFVGAAQTVTGSKHLVHTDHATVLLDCGLFQGRRRESYDVNKELGFRASEVDVAVLSHAHIDHSGALPMLCKNGFDGTIYATPATRDLCAVMLEDAAAIQKQDAEYINRSIEREHIDMDPATPLYDAQDVVKVLERMISVPYARTVHIADGIKLTFHDAGHVLGSAITVLDVEDGGKKKRIVFTGDLGRTKIPILRDPEFVDGAIALVTESTYGDRLHPPLEAMDEALVALIKRVYDRGGKLIVPSFALERAQEVVFAIKRLRSKKLIPQIPVYVDSPLTVKITDVFKMHPECYDEETRALIAGRESPFEFDDLHYVSDKEDSKRLDASSEPSIIISASGMCEAGRVLHHLKASVEEPKNAVMIVGFQAPHTLGRRIVERRKRVKIFGVERDLRAEVAIMNGFSAHADQNDLLAYATHTRDTGPLEQVILVHGEPGPQKVLREKLAAKGITNVSNPKPTDTIEI